MGSYFLIRGISFFTGGWPPEQAYLLYGIPELKESFKQTQLSLYIGIMSIMALSIYTSNLIVEENEIDESFLDK